MRLRRVFNITCFREIIINTSTDFKTNLFDSTKKLVKACVRESPEGTTEDNSIRDHVKVVTSIKRCYRDNLSDKDDTISQLHKSAYSQNIYYAQTDT